MTYQETVREVFPNATAKREHRSLGGGYTVTSDGDRDRLSWAPSARDAWELAAGSIAVKRAYMVAFNAI